MRPMTGFLPIVLALLPACEARNLYVAHQTILGVNAAVDQGRQQGQLVIGYDRDFATVIPTSVPVPDKPGETDAMALLNCTLVEVDGIYLNRYSDITVTGDAAVDMVATGQVNAANFDCEQQQTGQE